MASCWGTARYQCVAGHRMHAEAMAPLVVQGVQLHLTEAIAAAWSACACVGEWLLGLICEA